MSGDINFLAETISILRDNGHTPDDVKWCGDSHKWFTWAEFAERANFTYDNGYGGQRIQDDLLIVGSNWWLERHEYDGSEWWEYKQLPKKPKLHEVPNNLNDRW